MNPQIANRSSDSVTFLKNKFIVPILIASLVVLMAGVVLISRHHTKQNPSSVTLKHQPIYSVSGAIQNSSGNSITISQNVTNPSKETPLIILITNSTTISLIGNTKTSLSSSIQNLKVGQQVTVVSSVDLSTLKTNQIEAKSITTAPPTTSTRGIITNSNANLIKLKAGTSPKEYLVTINPDTVIERVEPGKSLGQMPRVTKLSASDLKTGLQIDVYANSDISSLQTFTATKIELVIKPKPTP